MLILDHRSVFFSITDPGSRGQNSSRPLIQFRNSALNIGFSFFISYCDESYVFCFADTGGVGEELHDVKFFLLDSAGDIQGKKLQTLQSTLNLQS